MAVEFVDVLRRRIGRRIESNKLRARDEVLHERQTIRIKCRLPTSLPYDDSTLDGLCITQPFRKGRHVVGRRTIKRSHVEAADEGARLHELDRQEEGR